MATKGEKQESVKHDKKTGETRKDVASAPRNEVRDA